MNIVYTTNDLFCAKVGASICSIFENNKSADDITIFIIEKLKLSHWII